MPVLKCPNGKYRIGSGPCMYSSKASAERAYAAYRARTHSESPKDDGIYARYICGKCKSERLLPKSEGLPVILLCQNCNGFMKPQLTVLLQADVPESRYQEADGWRTLFFEALQDDDDVLNIGENVELVRRQERNHWKTVAMRFKDSLTEGQMRKWMWLHFEVVREESVWNLSNVPLILRKIFQNRLTLFAEWRDYYIESIDMPFPNLVALHKLGEKWLKDKTGRWTKR